MSNAYAYTQFDSPITISEIGDALQAAHRDAEALRDQARAEGYAAGHAEGLAAAREQALPALAAITAAGHELGAQRDQLLAGVEQDAIALAFDLAAQILAAAVEVAPERVLDVARHALRHLAERRQVTLIVHPDDLALLSEAVPEIQSELGGIEHLSVQADRRVMRGGAIARTVAGEIDAGLTAQLSRARDLVADALAGQLPAAATLTAPLAAGSPDAEPALADVVDEY